MQVKTWHNKNLIYSEHFLTLLIAGQPTTTICKWIKIKNTKRKVKFTSTGKCIILDTKAVDSYQIISWSATEQQGVWCLISWRLLYLPVYKLISHNHDKRSPKKPSNYTWVTTQVLEEWYDEALVHQIIGIKY